MTEAQECFFLVETPYDSGILSAEKGKETERSTGNSSLFSSSAT